MGRGPQCVCFFATTIIEYPLHAIWYYFQSITAFAKLNGIWAPSTQRSNHRSLQSWTEPVQVPENPADQPIGSQNIPWSKCESIHLDHPNISTYPSFVNFAGSSHLWINSVHTSLLLSGGWIRILRFAFPLRRLHALRREFVPWFQPPYGISQWWIKDDKRCMTNLITRDTPLSYLPSLLPTFSIYEYQENSECPQLSWFAWYQSDSRRLLSF